MNAMTLYGMPGGAIVGLAVVWAACWDLLYRRIPNRLTAVLLGAWFVAAAWSGFRHGLGVFPLPGMVVGLGCFAAVLAVGFLLFSMGAVGAGDVKLAAVLCLWLGEGAFPFLIATSLAGGVMVLQLPLLRRLETLLAFLVMRLPVPAGGAPRRTPVALLEGGTGGLPYGPAIAAGTFFTMVRTWA